MAIQILAWIGCKYILSESQYPLAHLNINKIGVNLSVPGIQGHQENALIKSFELSPNLTCLYDSIKIPLGPASLRIKSGFRLAQKICWC